MPSHPDRVRRNYQENKKAIIYFRDIPIHICDKASKDPPIHLLSRDMTECPFCFEKIEFQRS